MKTVDRYYLPLDMLGITMFTHTKDLVSLHTLLEMKLCLHTTSKSKVITIYNFCGWVL